MCLPQGAFCSGWVAPASQCYAIIRPVSYPNTTGLTPSTAPVINLAEFQLLVGGSMLLPSQVVMSMSSAALWAYKDSYNLNPPNGTLPLTGNFCNGVGQGAGALRAGPPRRGVRGGAER